MTMPLKKQMNEPHHEKSLPASKQCPEENRASKVTAPMDLSRLRNGEAAIIVEHQGSGKFTSIMKAMGMLPGTTIVKKSSTPLNGPIVLEKNGVQFAIGKSTARKIIVKPIPH
jgi:Fe2+ transport system protein FeoA